MKSLDPLFIIAMAGFMSLVMSVVLGFMRRYYPPSIRGLGDWALAPAIWLVSAALLATPGGAPFEVLRFGGNVLVLCGFASFYLGCRRFFGQPAHVKSLIPGMVVMALALAWFHWLSPLYGVRLSLVTIGVIVLEAATLWVLVRRGNHHFPVRMAQVTLLLHLVVLCTRLAALAFGGPVKGIMDASVVQVVYLASSPACVLLLSISAVLMATERVRTELEVLATQDSLTETLNRRAILERGASEHARFVRYQQPFSLMMIDLDHFKAINDSLGHQHGDKVLMHFAQTTRDALRKPDQIGRYGGEEFLVLLPNTTAADAERVGDRIHASLSAGHPLDCRVSIGVTSCLGADDPIDAMLSRADAALYEAKARGRSQTCVQ